MKSPCEARSQYDFSSKIPPFVSSFLSLFVLFKISSLFPKLFVLFVSLRSQQPTYNTTAPNLKQHSAATALSNEVPLPFVFETTTVIKTEVCFSPAKNVECCDKIISLIFCHEDLEFCHFGSKNLPFSWYGTSSLDKIIWYTTYLFMSMEIEIEM